MGKPGLVLLTPVLGVLPTDVGDGDTSWMILKEGGPSGFGVDHHIYAES
jgi:hypothetical protein